MERSWYQKLFSGVQTPNLQTTQTKADHGDADAQFSLGLRYATSAAGTLDYTEAAQWYRKAADQNHSLAQFNLGVMYAEGQGVTQDDGEAAVWIQKAAQQGNPGAQHKMGTRSQRASMKAPLADALESKIEAYKWFHLAAAQGYKGSDMACEQVTLGMTHEELAEGNQRAAAFVSSNPATSHA